MAPSRCDRRPSRRSRSLSFGRPAAAATALALVLLAAGCSGSEGASGGGDAPATTGTAAPVVKYPGAAWDKVAPAAAGLDPAILDSISTELAGSATTCVVVVKDGEVAYETTFDGFDIETNKIVWSVSKSITSLLVGTAIEEGKLRLDQPAADFIPEWKGTPAEAVTVKHLLTMTSGRHFDYNTDFVVLPGRVDDQTAFSIGLEQDADPNTRWVYSNSAVQVLDAVLSKATGQSTIDYAEKKLFGPLGIEMEWLKDKTGHPWTYGGASMSCRELARIGYLMLHKGKWEDQQVVSEAWVDQSVQPSQELRSNYGLLWWLNTPEKPRPGAPADVQSGDRVAGLADNVFFARGLNGQFITVIPDEDMVVIRTGEKPTDKARFADEGKVLDRLLELVVKADQANPG